ncbi:PREDICTED: intracellular protein transport protein USO1 [Polistes canadensis]|uniref:intracellular protein transport protein USO1 n=1 Tax=Polistes canadensis TaxID=91411 RepID=UPI000718F3BB|nr:PREDICTED: intracellular protein transport protein USO1 [Polistes canadensis]
MTMTSVAVAPGSLVAPPAMLTPKMYHLQQPLNPSAPSPTSGKNYDTLSKSKKSWSVRLGLSRQNQNPDDPGKGWGTISNGSALSRQMIYGDPWLYGTVRSSRPGHDPRGFLTPAPPPPPGAPLLVVCSCPEFLCGTTRKLGSNCRKCGGHRLAGVPLGGTCRLPAPSSRSRPSLAGVLRPAMDDPYDQMRRNRLVEPRSRARSTSPHRPSSQRDSRSQSVLVGRNTKERKGSIEGTISRSEWFDKEGSVHPHQSHSHQPLHHHLHHHHHQQQQQQQQQQHEEPGRCKSRQNFVGVSNDHHWLEENQTENVVLRNGGIVERPNQRSIPRTSKRSNTIQRNKDNQDCSVSTKISSSSTVVETSLARTKTSNSNNNNNGQENIGDSRRSILECDVNPYLLLKKEKYEDDLSDDLSDNALEQDADLRTPSNLFDPSKVKSIERIPNRGAAVAAIGGQRIRVFNEPREISDDEENTTPVTRIPIPKVSPKRPPRKLKEAKQTLKSILKRGRVLESKRKNVLFKVDNVIFAPEKPSEATRLSWSRIGRFANCTKDARKEESEEDYEEEERPMIVVEEEEEEEEEPIVPREQQEKHKFITIPNISDPKTDRSKNKDTKIVPQVKNVLTYNNSSKIDTIVSSKPIDNVEMRKKSPEIKSNENVISTNKYERSKEIQKSPKKDNDQIKLEDETELEIEIEELNDRLPCIAVDEKDLILRSEENSRRPFLSRSQSDRSFSKPQVSATNVYFADTMRLSLGKKIKVSSSALETLTNELIKNTTIVDQDLSKEMNEMNDINETIPNNSEIIKTESEQEIEDDTLSNKTLEIIEKELDPVVSTLLIKDQENPMQEHFRGMKPTSWSPPPGRQKHRFKISDSEISTEDFGGSTIQDHRRSVSSASTLSWNSSSSHGSSKIEIGPSSSSESNVCKITVSPMASPLVHRLQIGPGLPTKTVKRTSILINGDQSSGVESTPDNKVTISVGGEDSVCNPTVISVNSEILPKIQSTVENRTLVILDNYKSNIVVESIADETRSKQNRIECPHKSEQRSRNLEDTFSLSSKSNKPVNILEETTVNLDKQIRISPDVPPKCNKSDQLSRVSLQEETKNQSEQKLKENEDTPKWSDLSKEVMISKLLEGSLRKARENGEILDHESGEAILKILKQSLLKSKEYESSESTLEANYSRTSSLNSDTDFVSTNLFLEENPYEVIKEPIYEEIPDEPPPLPLSPPPTEDFIKDRIYFTDVDYYKKVGPGEFMGSYLSEEVFKKTNSDDLADSYLSKSPEDFFKKISISPDEENISTKFELLNFLMDSKDRTTTADEEDEEEDDEEEDTEGDLEALYEQKETSLGDLSSKSSQISNVSDSSEECNIILTSLPETLKSRTVDIERTDSGVGSESSQASSTRGVARRWRSGNVSSGPGSLLSGIPQVISGDTKLCEDCEQRLDPLITDSGVVYAPFVCRKCSKKRAERKEIITEIVETEQKYGRDLQIILEEFHRPMLNAGLLTSEQLSAIFLNVEELLEDNLVLAEKLKDAVEFAQESGDEDLLTVDVGKIFLESERMLHAFENYCTRQGSASLLLQNLEKEKELLRIFLRVSQMENTVLRRMNLNSFLMVPVQRVTKYPLLLARLLKATPSVRPDIQEAKKRLKQAQTNIELHLEHMNAEAKDVTSTKLWRRISIIQNGRRSTGEQDVVNIKLRKMAVEILEWAHEEARFVLEGRLLVAQPTDNNWRRGRTVKLSPVTAMLVTNGKPTVEYVEFNDDSLFPRDIGIKDATLLLVKEKFGRYSLLREPLYLDKCIVCCETNLEEYFEIQELSSKETFIFKAEDGARTKRWCRTLQAHAQSLGAWRKRRGALPNIMICGVARN